MLCWGNIFPSTSLVYHLCLPHSQNCRVKYPLLLPRRPLISSQMSSVNTVGKKIPCPREEKPFLALTFFCSGSLFPVSAAWRLVLHQRRGKFWGTSLSRVSTRRGFTPSSSPFIKQEVGFCHLKFRPLNPQAASVAPRCLPVDVYINQGERA